MAFPIGYEIDFLYAGDRALFIRVVPVVLPDCVVIRLADVVDDPQIGFDDRPVLLQIVVRLIVQTIRESLAEVESDRNEKQCENECVDRRESKSKAACNVLASRHGGTGCRLLS